MRQNNSYRMGLSAAVTGVIGILCTLCGCRPETDCREQMTVGLVCEYADLSLDNTSQIQVHSTWDSLTVFGLGNTQPLYNNSRNISKITLPMRNDGDTTRFTLTYHNATDTLTVAHTNNLNFVSMECGCTYSHDILSISHTDHWIDSIHIENTEMTRLGETNIRIIHSTINNQ